MTGKDAIYILRVMRAYNLNFNDLRIKDKNEALDMAIKALSADPCEDVINRNDVEECVELMTDINGDTVYAVRMSDIRQIPSVTPKQKMGRWIRTSPAGIYECSECGHNVMTGDIYAYRHCHGCGAKMSEKRGSR